jgi:hypothetical protein
MSDTLVLKIEEIEAHNGVIVDTRLFVFYDANDGTYHLRGERTRTRNVVYKSYSFRCDTTDTLIDFIGLVMCKQNNLCFTLYNINVLPIESSDITYEKLYWTQSLTNEVAGYDNCKYKRKELKKILKLLRNVYNNY